MDLGIKGKNAIIAASSAGLGFACAESLAKEGVNVVINGRDKDRLDAAAEKLRLIAKGTVTGVVGDIALDETRAALLQACPRPDILITNNGGPPPGRFQDWGRDNWLSAVDSNMLAPLLLIRDVLDGMVERKFGRIINITSTSVFTPIKGLGVSNTVRAAMANWTRTLAGELGRFGITVNNVMPGFTRTARLDALFKGKASRGGTTVDEVERDAVATIPAGRLGEPRELAMAMLFLASPAASYVNGVNLPVDGGRLAAQ